MIKPSAETPQRPSRLLVYPTILYGITSILYGLP